MFPTTWGICFSLGSKPKASHFDHAQELLLRISSRLAFPGDRFTLRLH
jgi:hypothetical protein